MDRSVGCIRRWEEERRDVTTEVVEPHYAGPRRPHLLDSPDEKARKGFERHMTKCAVGENILASMWKGWMNG